MQKRLTLILTLLTTLIFASEGAVITTDGKTVAKTQEEKRVYPYGDTLQPILGYTYGKLAKGFGIDAFMGTETAQGANVHLTIDLALQQRIEKVLDTARNALDADDVLAVVMESNSGKIVAMASANRFDPNHITKQDIPILANKFTNYTYEPGFVIAPLVMAAALQKGLVKPEQTIYVNNGRYKIDGTHTLTDSEKHMMLTPEGIIVHSSNIGIAKIAEEFSGDEFRESLEAFGLGTKVPFPLKRNNAGRMQSAKRLNNALFRINTSYGYGMSATFLQLLQGYSLFDNDGKRVRPNIIASIERDGNVTLPEAPKPERILSSETTQIMRKFLVANVQKGTAQQAYYPGLEIGGKTGTAHIARKGRYVKEYHSSFYGFVDDASGHRYTIGVLVIRPKAPGAYFASRSAVSVFKRVVQEMVGQGYLKAERKSVGVK